MFLIYMRQSILVDLCRACLSLEPFLANNTGFLTMLHINLNLFAGAARRAGPDSKLILC